MLPTPHPSPHIIAHHLLSVAKPMARGAKRMAQSVKKAVLMSHAMQLVAQGHISGNRPLGPFFGKKGPHFGMPFRPMDPGHSAYTEITTSMSSSFGVLRSA